MKHDLVIHETWLMHIRLHDTVEHRLATLDVIDEVCLVWNVTDLFVWDVTHSHVRHDLCIYETWLIHTKDVTDAYTTMRHGGGEAGDAGCHWRGVSSMKRDLIIYMRRDSFTCETWLSHIWDMTRSYTRLLHTARHGGGWVGDTGCHWRGVRHDSFIYVWDTMSTLCLPFALCMRRDSFVYMWRDSFTCEIWRVHVWDVTRSRDSCM